MKDYSKMSDAEIAMRVACSIDGVDVDDNGIPKYAVDCYLYNSANSIKWLRVGDDEFEFFNPCNNPSDAWPIMKESLIGVTPDEDGVTMHFYGDWTARAHCKNLQFTDKNPLRAVMIVYLMMKDEEK